MEDSACLDEIDDDRTRRLLRCFSGDELFIVHPVTA